MLNEILKAHFANGATLASDRIGLGQQMPTGYAVMQTACKRLYWLNDKNESSEPIDTNDARLIRRMAIKHRGREFSDAVER